MDGRLIGILLESGLSLIAGVFLTYLGFFSPIFGRNSEHLAPDRWVGTFRLIARIVGPVLCLVAGLKIYRDIHLENTPQILQWREISSTEGRFRVSLPADFEKEVKDVPYGEYRVVESNFRALLPKLGFLVSYVDLPESLRTVDPAVALNSELDARVQIAGVKLLNKESIRFAGYPALRFNLQYVAGGYFVEGILLLAGERRYQLAVQFTSESSQQNREQFFHSFQVINKP